MVKLVYEVINLDKIYPHIKEISDADLGTEIFSLVKYLNQLQKEYNARIRTESAKVD